MTDYTFYKLSCDAAVFPDGRAVPAAAAGGALITAHGTVGELMLRERGKPLVLHILSDTNMGGAGQYLLNLFLPMTGSNMPWRWWCLVVR